MQHCRKPPPRSQRHVLYHDCQFLFSIHTLRVLRCLFVYIWVLCPPSQVNHLAQMSWRARFTPCVGNMVLWINPKDPNCFGVRNWWKNNVPELQMLNPFCNFNMQEITFGEPHMHVAYSPIDHRMIRLAGATEEEMEDIMEACITYATNHAVQEKERADDGGDATNSANIISFGYTESFMAKLEVSPPADIGQRTTEGVDDPGQKPRLMPRNVGYKLMP